MDLQCNLNIKHKHFFRKSLKNHVAIPFSSRLESCLNWAKNQACLKGGAQGAAAPPDF